LEILTIFFGESILKFVTFGPRHHDGAGAEDGGRVRPAVRHQPPGIDFMKLFFRKKISDKNNFRRKNIGKKFYFFTQTISGKNFSNKKFGDIKVFEQFFINQLL
jgi:hypothetical protein